MDRERIVIADKRHVWHPYTPMDEYMERAMPLVVGRADRSRFFDADGRSYIDGNASWWTSVLGHNHPRLMKALCDQARSFCHVPLAGMTHQPAAELAQELVGVAPSGLEHVFFVDNGSTAVEVALKQSVQFWVQNGQPRKTGFVALEGAFHGETLGATAVSGVDVFRRPFEKVLPRCEHVPFPGEDCDQAIQALRNLLSREAFELAALVVEPVLQGAGGMRVYDPRFLSAARTLCHEHDVLLIFDEVFTGYGRTGPMWAAEHAGVCPDILCTAKGLSGGLLPFGATLTNQRIFDGFRGDSERALYYGHTFCGNPLGAAVALEVLRIYREEQILERAKSKARRIGEAFAKLGELPSVQSSRSLGMLGALDLKGGSGYLERAGARVCSEALRRGAYLRPLGNVVYIAPALNIDDSDLDELLAILTACVSAVS